jgi:hypothetical protein
MQQSAWGISKMLAESTSHANARKDWAKVVKKLHGEGKCESLSCDGVAESKGKRHPDLGLKGSRPRRWRHVGLADLLDSTPANTWQVQERAFSRAKIRLIGHNRADGDSGVALGFSEK